MIPAANVSHLWPELPFLDRLDAASTAGFGAVEVLFPYDQPARDLKRALLRGGLKLVLINAPPPNFTGGPQGFAADPDVVDRFDRDMRRSFRFAGEFGVPMIHVMAGPGRGETAQQTMTDNLRRACAEAPDGITLTIEPLCDVAQPGYFLNDYELAADIIAQVGAPNLALQFDSFHAQMIHGNAAETYERFREIIGHVQLGDAPDRSAPGTGTVDFAALFEAMRAHGYAGYVSGEYTPGTETEDTLGWMEAL
ncbi:hydroxypyruvate isomerase family protein [Sulfitobacter sp. S190]|uniref:hydroxypyruvate isomerase family protein n=1 Tax=Sulfitobacter sp. S190 TaxID=2867022 RepID=UPI0021A7FDF8|nr:TIM barrel protein [Sulfitobacter sp. S190]UWR22309.1 TIM barrel protein [Sulfitobacter sp. S190]